MDLHSAAHRGNLKKLKKLLDRGADPNAYSHEADDDERHTPLMAAITERQYACVELLLQRGAQPDDRLPGDRKAAVTPLMIACMLGDDRSAKLLIDAHATLNAADPESFTALHHACHAGHAGCVSLLLAHLVDRTRLCSGMTALEMARSRSNHACVRAFDTATVRPAVLLSPGQSVRLVGLVSRSDLNGSLAVVRNFDDARKRYRVVAAEGTDEEEEMAVKPENIRCEEEDVSDPNQVICATCKAEEGEVTFQVCGMCVEKRVAQPRKYCSTACQKQDWKANHKVWHTVQGSVVEGISARFAETGIWERARERMEEQVADAESPYERNMALGSLAFVANDRKKAASRFKKAIAANPDMPGAYLQLGMTLRSDQSHKEGASACLLAVQRCAPDTADWGMSLLILISCIADFNGKFIMLHPGMEEVTPKWYYDFDEHIKIAARVCTCMPENDSAWHWQASLHAFLNRQSSVAADCFRRAAEAANNAAAHPLLGDSSFNITSNKYLEYAREAEDGTGEPPMPGMW
eukprot:scaffold51500_cov64-Phaeocystis_antarctica.AAC.2